MSKNQKVQDGRRVQRPGRIALALVRRVLLGLLMIWTLAPILWIFLTSLKSRAQILSSSPVFFFEPDFSAYRDILSDGNNGILLELLNSFGIAIASTVLTLVLASLAAYAFSRFKFPGRRNLLLVMLATRLMPPIVAIVPLFLMMSSFNLVDTQFGLVIIYSALSIPLAIWLLQTFFDGIPVELEEAAMLDGATRLRVLRSITLPLAAPGLAATAIFTFLLAWNEFLFAFIFTSTRSLTVPVLLTQTVGELEVLWQRMAAITVILIIPAMAFAWVQAKSLVSGLGSGALK